jgi:large conductance mechanosensitive channel
LTTVAKKCIIYSTKTFSKKGHKMKNFFAEFKKFITRGNVVDMAVGVIVGGAFTAIVNGLSNNILKPLINMFLFKVLGEGSLENIYTILHPVYTVDATTGDFLFDPETGEKILDLAKTIYIDWGAFINAILNFFIIAFVLFVIVKVINGLREERSEFIESVNSKKLTKEQRKELKAAGISTNNRKAVEAYFAEKKRLADEKAAEEAAAAAEAAKKEREANPTTEDLLKMILAELKNK